MNLKKYVTDGHELTYSSGWINSLEAAEHWGYYWNQANLVWNHIDKSQKILEVGIGTGFLSKYLKGNGWRVATIDIDKEKKPDYVGDISSIDLSQIDFDCVVAFEIFEHLPYPLFLRTVKNICYAKPRCIIFSIPWSVRRLCEFQIKLPKIRRMGISLYIPKKKVTTTTHFWELKKNGAIERSVMYGGEKGLVPLKHVMDLFSEYGYKVRKESKVNNIQFFIANQIIEI